MTGILILCMLMLWIFALAIHLFGAFTSHRHFNEHPLPADAPYRLIPVSILKPLKGIDHGLKENLESFFLLDYPEYELIFSVADARDPAGEVVSELMRSYPQVSARLIIGEVVVGKNPKINNLIRSYEQARHSWILISDSNIRARRNYLKRMVSQIDCDTGMLTSVVLGTGATSLAGKLEEVHLNTFYTKAMVLAAWAKRDCVVGKSMLFQKSSAERFGGLKALGGFLAEDYMAGEAIKQLGLKVATAWEAVPQHIGEYSLKDYWKRHVRWGRIRKSQVPLAFLVELLGSSIVPGFFCSFALSSLFGLDGILTFLAHTFFWASFDLTVMQSVGARTDLKTIVYWLMREVLAVPLWFHIASGNSVDWRGEKYRIRMGGVLVGVD